MKGVAMNMPASMGGMMAGMTIWWAVGLLLIVLLVVVIVRLLRRR